MRGVAVFKGKIFSQPHLTDEIIKVQREKRAGQSTQDHPAMSAADREHSRPSPAGRLLLGLKLWVRRLKEMTGQAQTPHRDWPPGGLVQVTSSHLCCLTYKIV
jgi:hypothetical protein